MSAPQPNPVLLSGVVNLQTVVAMRAEAVARGKAASDGETAVTFDLKELTVEGSAVVTLLLSLVRDLRKSSGSLDVQFINPSEQLLSIAAASGVAEVLKLQVLD